jgi:hypothetical protein
MVIVKRLRGIIEEPSIGDDLEAGRLPIMESLALYIGGLSPT